VWTPDKEHFEKYDQPVLYPDEVTSKWKLPPWNRKLQVFHFSFVCFIGSEFKGVDVVLRNFLIHLFNNVIIYTNYILHCTSTIHDHLLI